MSKTIVLEIGIGYPFTVSKHTNLSKVDWDKLSDDERVEITNELVWEVVCVSEVER